MPELLPDLIVTHNTDRNRTYPEADYRTHLLLYRVQSGLGELPPAWFHSDIKLVAYINYGCWCVDCNICHTAVRAEPTDPWFSCPSCGSGGEWLAVVFPDPEFKSKLEALMLMRPGFRHSAPARNWVPGIETLDIIRTQNLAEGDPVDQQPELEEVEV